MTDGLFCCNALILGDSQLLFRGASIALAGLLIVFLALLMITLFITLLPRLLVLFAHVWPEVESAHAGDSHIETLDVDDGAVLAAIGFVLHTELQKQLAAEQASRG